MMMLFITSVITVSLTQSLLLFMSIKLTAMQSRHMQYAWDAILPDKSMPIFCLQPLNMASMQLHSLEKRLWLSVLTATLSATVL